MEGLTAGNILAGPAVSTGLGWVGNTIAIALAFLVGLLMNVIPQFRRAKTWQRIVIGGIAGGIAYLAISFLMGSLFHEQLG